MTKKGDIEQPCQMTSHIEDLVEARELYLYCMVLDLECRMVIEGLKSPSRVSGVTSPSRPQSPHVIGPFEFYCSCVAGNTRDFVLLEQQDLEGVFWCASTMRGCTGHGPYQPRAGGESEVGAG